jgi:hypothetical protein
LIDEANEAEISDTEDILPSLNRGLDDATDLLARKYPDPIIQPLDLSLSEGVNGLFDIPEDAFQERLEKVEARQNGYYTEVQRIDYRDITQFDYPATSGTPYYYAIIGSQFRLIPNPGSIDAIRIWYIPEVGPLVPEYGRITYINRSVSPQYVNITDVEDLDLVTTDITSLEAFVNIVDGRTGKIKATMQVNRVASNTIRFTSSPQLTNVDGRTVVGSIPASVQEGDYLCPVVGTCIPPMRSPLTNFLIAYCSAEIKALKLDGDPGMVNKMLDKFEQRIERTWVGREQTARVSKVSRNWGPKGMNFWSRTPRDT